MDPIKCDICGEEIPKQDLHVSGGKSIRFCKECKKGLTDGLLPPSANKKGDGLFDMSAVNDQDGLYQPPKDDREGGLYEPPEDDTEGLYKPDEE